MSYFGDKLRAKRKEHGLSQAELANQLGMTKSRINMYERGEREPKFAVAAQIADYFGTDINEMLGIPRTAHIDLVAGPGSDGGIALTLTPDESALISAYRSLPDEGKNYLRQVITLAGLMSGKQGEK